mmetsp:Transcript_19224/g.28271  ORF Transcript_19224/g.28271 Transcript_19224/m.28271 type:complete len:103 (+) Transcript_19224:633-941(+)
MVKSLSAQEVKLVSWRKCFRRLPSTPSLLPEQGEPSAGISWMEDMYPCCLKAYNRAFRAALSECERALCDVKYKYYKQYNFLRAKARDVCPRPSLPFPFFPH